MRALIDTGAKRNCINHKLMRRLRLPLGINQGKCLYGANNNRIPVLATMDIDITINGLKLTSTFDVIDNLSYDVILGMDIMTKNNAVIDLAEGIVSFQNDLVVATIQNNGNKPIARIKNLYSITIKPNSRAFIPCRIDKRYRWQISMIESLDNLCTKNLAMARAVVNPKSCNIMCEVMNPSGRPIFLKKGYPIGRIEPVVVNEGKDDNANIETEQRSTQQQAPRASEEILKEMGVTLQEDQMTAEELTIMTEFLVANKDMFSQGMSDLPGSDLVKHRIETGDAQPIKQRAYRTSPAEQTEIMKQTQEMLKLGVIKPSISPWSSPIVLVIKKDKTHRFCVDFRKLNAVTRPEFCMLPTFDSVVDEMADKQPKCFSIIDMKNGFWQVKLDEETAHKTAFSVQGQGQYQFCRLPFGMLNSSFVFQNLMQTVLQNLLFKYTLVYIDDCLVYSKNMQEHREHLNEVFRRFRQANLRLNGKKCQFGVKQVPYLGYILTGEGIKMDESKVELMKDFPQPKSVRELKSWLGLTGFYRRFIKSYAAIVQPMHNLLKKDIPFLWNSDCETAFQLLKEKLTTAPILRYPDFSKSFTLLTDASYSSISFILTQEDEGKFGHPVAYGGRSLTAAERNYSVSQIELLAILCGCRHFHPYLAGRRFKVITDHVSLKYLETLKMSSGRLARWSLFLMAYDMEVVHVAGKSHLIADAISRVEHDPKYTKEDVEEQFEDLLTITEGEEKSYERFTYNPMRGRQPICIELENEESELKEDNTEIVAEIETEETEMVSFDAEDIAPLQRTCPEFRQIMAYIEKGILPTNAHEARSVIAKSETYEMIDNRLHHIWEPKDRHLIELKPRINQLCIPRSLREEIIQGYHHNNCHVGFDRTYASIKESYYWPNLYTDVYNVINGCENCQRSKKLPNKKVKPLDPTKPVQVMDRINIDIIGPLPQSEPDKFKFILVVIESLSRFPILIPLVSQKAEYIAEALYTKVFSLLGVPLQITSDLGKNLTSKVLQSLFSMFKIKHRTTSAHHQAGNSRCENYNRSILQAFRLHCTEQNQWPKYLPMIEYSYRSTTAITTTKLTPYEILFGGRKMRLAVDTKFQTPKNMNEDAETFIESLKKRMEIVDKMAREKTEETSQKSKHYYDRNAKEPEFKQGDKCWLQDMNRSIGVNKKMCKNYIGPYIITEKCTSGSYRLRHAITDKPIPHTVHADHLKAFVEEASIYPETRRSKATEEKAGNVLPRLRAQDKNQENDTSQQDIVETGIKSSTDVTQIPKKQGNEYYGFKKLLTRRKVGQKWHYKILWEDDTTSWEPAENVTLAAKQEFVRTHKPRKQRRY